MLDASRTAVYGLNWTECRAAIQSGHELVGVYPTDLERPARGQEQTQMGSRCPDLPVCTATAIEVFCRRVGPRNVAAASSRNTFFVRSGSSAFLGRPYLQTWPLCEVPGVAPIIIVRSACKTFFRGYPLTPGGCLRVSSVSFPPNKR